MVKHREMRKINALFSDDQHSVHFRLIHTHHMIHTHHNHSPFPCTKFPLYQANVLSQSVSWQMLARKAVIWSFNDPALLYLGDQGCSIPGKVVGDRVRILRDLRESVYREQLRRVSSSAGAVCCHWHATILP